MIRKLLLIAAIVILSAIAARAFQGTYPCPYDGATAYFRYSKAS